MAGIRTIFVEENEWMTGEEGDSFRGRILCEARDAAAAHNALVVIKTRGKFGARVVWRCDGRYWLHADRDQAAPTWEEAVAATLKRRRGKD